SSWRATSSEGDALRGWWRPPRREARAPSAEGRAPSRGGFPPRYEPSVPAWKGLTIARNGPDASVIEAVFVQQNRGVAIERRGLRPPPRSPDFLSPAPTKVLLGRQIEPPAATIPWQDEHGCRAALPG